MQSDDWNLASSKSDGDVHSCTQSETSREEKPALNAVSGRRCALAVFGGCRACPYRLARSARSEQQVGLRTMAARRATPAVAELKRR
jgi:hypothetical protein